MKAALYCRLSKEDAGRVGESESIQNQKAILLQYALEQGLEIYQIYCDEDYSGMDRDRPAFQALLQGAREHKFDLVLAKTQSRFTRDMELVEKYLHGKFPQWGIRFVAVVDRVDTQDPANKKSRQINGLVNEWYLEDLSRNVRSVLDQKRRAGLSIASFPLYGYQKDPRQKGKLLPDPPAAQVVKEIFALALGGLGARKIAQTLNQAGIPSPAAYKALQGIPCAVGERPLWSPATVSRILHNRTYAGDLVQGRHKKASYKSKKILSLPPDQWITVPATHPPLIDPGTFDTLQAMLERRARSGEGGQVHPLARLAFCGCCGGALEQTSGGAGQGEKRRRYLRCRVHQRAPQLCPNRTCTDLEALEQAVAHRVRAYAAAWFDPEALALPRPGKADSPEQAQLDRLCREVERRQKALETLYLDRAAGVVEPDLFARMQQSFLQDTARTREQIRLLEEHLARQPSAVAEPSPRAAAEILAQIPSLTRELAVLLVRRIEVFPKDPDTGTQEITLYWNF